jgi:hypothetical protein
MRLRSPTFKKDGFSMSYSGQPAARATPAKVPNVMSSMG